jgi:hypothetical protein
MAVDQKIRPSLAFDKDGKLISVTIITDKWEGQQYRIYFWRDNDKMRNSFQPIGEHSSLWIPGRLFNPASKQARAIFRDYRRQEEKRPSPKAR